MKSAQSLWADEPSLYDVKYPLDWRKPNERNLDVLKMVELSGFEPLTLCLQSRCSTN